MSRDDWRNRTTGLILSGGASQRMQALGPGTDKGLLRLADRSLVEHAVARLRPQVGAIVISANRHLDAYRALGWPVVTDAGHGQPRATAQAHAPYESLAEAPPREGPLAGLLAGLATIAGQPDRWLLCVPCDVPGFPLDLFDRFAAALEARSADAAIARTPVRRHPVFTMLRASAGERLATCFQAGERRIGIALASLPAIEVGFDDEAAFANLNTPDELRDAAAPGSASAIEND